MIRRCTECNGLYETFDESVVLCKECRPIEDPEKHAEIQALRQLQKIDNSGWVEACERDERNIWDQQPGEDLREYNLWLLYKDQYPQVKPTYARTASLAEVSPNVIRNIAAKWDWRIRLQAWAQHCQELSMKARKDRIVEMNTRQQRMSEALQEKLATAIDNIDPYTLTPGEINGLMKTAMQLERTAVVDETEEWTPMVTGGKSAEEKESVTKKDDLKEVMSILAAAGLMSNKTIGVEQTTRVIVKGSDGEY